MNSLTETAHVALSTSNSIQQDTVSASFSTFASVTGNEENVTEQASAIGTPNQPVPEPVLKAINVIRRYWRKIPFMGTVTVELFLERVPQERILAIRSALGRVFDSRNAETRAKFAYEQAKAAHDAEERRWHKSRLATRMRMAHGEYVRASNRLRVDENYFGVTAFKNELRDRLLNTVEGYAALLVARAQLEAEIALQRQRDFEARDITNQRVGGYPNYAIDTDHWANR